MKKIDIREIDSIPDYVVDCFEEIIHYIRYKKEAIDQDTEVKQFCEDILNLINSFVLKVKELALKVYEK